MVAMTILDHPLTAGGTQLLIECDTSKPNVGKAHGETVACELVNLGDADGCVHLVIWRHEHQGSAGRRCAMRGTTKR